MGTTVLCFAAGYFGMREAAGPAGVWLVGGATAYLLGPLGVTVALNVPLNNRLAVVQGEGAEVEWPAYQRAWLRWNHGRTTRGGWIRRAILTSRPSDDITMLIRTATRSDVEAIDRIAFRAKAFWGYAPHQIERWRTELMTPPESVESRPTQVAVIDHQIVAFAQLDPQREPWELASLFTLPEYNRRGIGRALLLHMAAMAHSAGRAELQIDADPNACGFYLACGAFQVGEVAAPIENEPLRTRPQLRLPTAPLAN